MNVFRTSLEVRFAHCDPAGIAYYPRIFELCDIAIEDWTAAILKVSRREMNLEMGLGLPTVTLDASFTAPARIGDVLDIEIVVERVGTSSVDLALKAACNQEDLFSIRYRQVLFTLEDGKSRPWPDDWRSRLVEAAAREMSA